MTYPPSTAVPEEQEGNVPESIRRHASPVSPVMKPWRATLRLHRLRHQSKREEAPCGKKFNSVERIQNNLPDSLGAAKSTNVLELYY